MHMQSGTEVCSVFCDLKKAFDKVPHKPLIDKLHCIGINNHMIQWISSYLTERKQRVIVNGAESSTAHVLSGVPQGSILGLVFFLVYVSDLSFLPLTEGTQFLLYADDILVYRPIHSIQDYKCLQNDLDLITQCGSFSKSVHVRNLCSRASKNR